MNKPKAKKTDGEKQHGTVKEVGDDMSARPDLPEDFLVVGLGASAGGVQALKEFFENVPANSGMAYVVILHLSPDYDSQLAEILQTVAQIPVRQVTSRTKVEPNHVYVVPPNEHLEMSADEIVVSPNITLEARRAPVDIFFRTLAESHHARAVAVVLSGTGANGSMGIKRIKERGGAAFVQNPREAEFSEMPRNSIATDLIDQILNVCDIPARIIAYKKSLGKIEIPAEAEKRPEATQQALREIFTHLRVRTGHDFSNYKRPTILRRIERRINVFDLPDIAAYARFLGDNREEPNALLKDLLISVTNFFRDKEAFRYLEHNVLPSIFYGKQAEDQVRIWVAGCATGEEAYSMAMLCAERTFGVIDAPGVQIFATDIDEAAIATAREGFYTLNDAADVSPERLRRFFTKQGNQYRIRRELREMILFANHNVIKDPPFSRVDAVTCRNMLIYLNPTAQERVMETFHFALKPGGFLFLGNSESVDGASDLYAVVNKENHIFQSRQASSRIVYPAPETSHRFANFSFETTQEAAPTTTTNIQNETNSEIERRPQQSLERISFGDLHQQLLELYAPPSVVINVEYEIVHLSERAGRYLQIAGGEPTKNLLKLIRPELRLELRAALYQAVQNQTSVEVKNLKIRIDDRDETLNIHARPVLAGGNAPTADKNSFAESDKSNAVTNSGVSSSLARGFILVVFEQTKNDDKTASQAVYTSQEPLSRHLEEELLRTKSQLRNTIEQFEVQAEELKASNEELQALNEELRSSAEELETSKEELQSVNEELITVNQELKIKVEELSQSNNDFQNLIISTEIATIFLDRSFRVHTFTPAASRIFNLIPADIGRPLTDITHRLEQSELLADAERVLENLQAVERETRTDDGRTYIVRILPYRTAEDRINGIVASFIDITAQKRAEEAVRQSAAEQTFRLRIADEIRSLSDAVEITNIVTQTAMNYFQADRCFYGEIEGDIAIIHRDAHRVDLPSMANVYSMSEMPLFKAAFENEQPIVVPDIHASGLMDNSIKQLCESASILSYINVPIIKNKRHVGIFCLTQSRARVWTDVEIELAKETAERTWTAVERARAEEAMRESESRLRTLVENLPGGAVFIVDKNLRYLVAEGEALAIAGFKSSDFVGRTVHEIIPPEFVTDYEKRFRQVLAGESFESEHQAHNRTFVSRGVPLTNESGDIYAILAISYDITEIKLNERALRESETRYRAIIGQSTAGVAEFNLNGDHALVNPGFCEMTGYTEAELLKMNLRDVTHPDDYPMCLELFEDTIKTGAAHGAEKRIVCKNGSVVWTAESLACIGDGESNALRVAMIAIDITNRVRAEEALAESEERLRLLIESASDHAIYTLTPNNLIDSWNSGAEKVFGWTETEVLGKSGEIVFIPEDREKGAPEQELEIALRDGRAPDERFHLRKDGSLFYASGVTTVLRYGGANVHGFVKIARDMTEQINAEKALRDRELLQKLVAAQEDERKRIARDLHDELGQQLIALRLKIELTKQSCKDEELSAKIVEMEQIARSIDHGVDFLAWELRPTALDHLGLFAALENYINQWSRHSGIAAELLNSKLKRTRFAPAVETNLYRIVQEALNNTHKHARAKNVVVILEKRDDLIVLVIEDDGIGFNPKSKKLTSKGLGLIGMKERAHLIGGEIEIESAPGKGTTVFVRIPASIVKRKRTDEK